MAAHLTFPNAAALFALFPLTIGPVMLFKPEIVPSTFETKFPLGFEDQKLAISITRLMAVRDTFLGGAILVPWYHEDNKILGSMVLMGSAVLAADGLIQKAQAGRGQWLHWSVVLPTLGIAARLLDWL
ncbi:hypothetical protein D0867_05447 [Hortaea werneckii]|uniref:Uncharacterized protein n=1 Tax=Hortaea werneckii TaxID=91943 RepID=A0A3M6ZSV8_HORWE|nr:hypothetical protein D0867_05447 [Hortaea werneckii]RMY39349.1 hypothetical protein D0866_01991 [Hortaea werneckii]